MDTDIVGLLMCDDFSAARLDSGFWAAFSRGSGQTRSDHQFWMISRHGGSRAGFRLLGRPSRGSGQTRLDLLFLMISGLGGSRAGSRAGSRLLGCLPRVSSQTRSDREFSKISGLGASWDGFQLLGYLSRGSGQTRSDRLILIEISVLALPALDPSFWAIFREAPARLAQIVHFR